MATTMKGLLKGLRYITQIFDEEKEPEMQIGFPTDVKHVAHIGSDSPSANTPTWMNDFKPQDQENGQVGPRGDDKNQGPKFNPEGKNQRGVGLQELLPPVHTEKPKSKARRKPGASSPNGSPPRRSTGTAPDAPSKPSRRNRTSHTSMDSSVDSDASVRRRRGVSVPDIAAAYPLGDGSAPPRKPTSRPRRLKGQVGGEQSMKKTKGKDENSNVQSDDSSEKN